MQTQQRQKDDDDDHDAGGYRHGHLDRGAIDVMQQGHALRRARVGLPRFDVLDHHHGRIDQHAYGNGQSAQGHQVGRQSGQAHGNDGDQARQW